MYLFRPHHGLCSLFFEGKGYSDAFVARMTEVIGAAESGEGLRLHCGCDAICECCPNRQGADCSGMNAAAYDRRVLDMTGLDEGETLTLPELHQAVIEEVLLQGRLEEVCGGCQWMDICSRSWERLSMSCEM